MKIFSKVGWVWFGGMLLSIFFIGLVTLSQNDWSWVSGVDAHWDSSREFGIWLMPQLVFWFVALSPLMLNYNLFPEKTLIHR